MLALAETYFGRIRKALNDTDIIDILADLSADLGFRSGYLVEYANAFKSAALILDSSSARAGWWDQYVSNGLRTSTKVAADIVDKGGVQYLDETRFSDPRDPVFAFARKTDMINLAIVPIKFTDDVAGLIALCGEKHLSPEEERALQMLSYSLFAQARVLRTSGVFAGRPSLTPREREVISLSSQGFSAQQVAEELGMSARTVTQHMDNVAEKLGTKNRVHTVAEALKRDLL
ncbi:hypothetical protein VW35_03525 [Devosia soli]|uniref:HTH luxR-type domain-containing protein n=1 Tax=Devosia soli TaxID=361041 RepID=A0A0F5LG93_9HYPH|nr:LuxR C-terminal-related transcriptional regulator [Devosia soli]KKB81214.1 hypothetical protein VW35_03525 [Devosia soli]